MYRHIGSNLDAAVKAWPDNCEITSFKFEDKPLCANISKGSVLHSPNPPPKKKLTETKLDNNFVLHALNSWRKKGYGQPHERVY